MMCPVCNNVDLKMAERQGVEIDYCPKCRGVWLDRGELDKIIEFSTPRSESGGERRPGSFFDDDDRDYNERGRRKRKSLLGNLFDF
ncbi:MAG TPA: hypothetical protein DCQ14_05330 [Firmicutes bacterium]|nr:hypothetical protein [Bacillota bacterium]